MRTIPKLTAEPWMEHANCRGVNPEAFYPARGESCETARAVCEECTVRVECLEFALRHNIREGVWGGTSERQRKRIRETRRKAG